VTRLLCLCSSCGRGKALAPLQVDPVGPFTGPGMAVAMHLERVTPSEKLAGFRQLTVALGQVKFVQLSLLLSALSLLFLGESA